MPKRIQVTYYTPLSGNPSSGRFTLFTSPVGLLAAALIIASAPTLYAQNDVAPSSTDNTVVRVVGGKRDADIDAEAHLGSGAPAQGIGAEPTETFRFSGEAQTVVVPEGANEAVVRVVGAAGGRTEGAGDGSYYSGGNGAQITGRIAVDPGQILSVFVGQYGGDGELNKNPGKGGLGITGRGGRGGAARIATEPAGAARAASRLGTKPS